MAVAITPTHDTELARFARRYYSGYGWCYRCGFPWAVVEGHSTRYNAHYGCFPLCEGCWTLLGHPEARIPYYRTLLDAWESDGIPTPPDEVRAIGLAVANGL